MTARGLGIGLVLALGIATGCGSGSDDSENEAQEVVERLRSLEKGEIFIQGLSAPRVFGPYRFKPGGYTFNYTHESTAQLTVALESKPRSRAEPYQLLVDSDRATGTGSVALTGKLYVHVLEADGEYVLRFRPKQR